MRPLTLLLPIGLAAGGWAWAAATAEVPAALPPVVASAAPAKPYGTDVPNFRYAANTSCAAASCHGNQIQVNRPGGEQATWASSMNPHAMHDPHRRAYAVLFNDDSVRISKLLNRPPAHTDALCLKCHALDHDKFFDGQRIEWAKADGTVVADRVLSEGVSCESCHGPSEKWLTAHYEAGWKGIPAKEKFDRFGFVPTKNLVARVLNCAACHVGAADREVNHDLIAAGHPRLNFEAARFHYWPKYKQHWTEQTPQPDFELRAWYVGQLASLRSALATLQVRAEKAGADEAPWPEFAESSCYACHQNIGRGPEDGPPRSEQVGRPKVENRRPGSLPWQTWYTGAYDVLPNVGKLLLPDVTEAVPNLQPLRAEMQKARANPAETAKLAAAATVQLDAWLAKVQEAEDAGRFRINPETAAAVANLLAADALQPGGGQLKDYDWDFVAAHYLGMAAAFHAAGGTAPGSLSGGWAKPIDALKAALAFPDAAENRQERFDSPMNYKPADALKPLQDLLRTTAPTRTSR